MNPYDMLKNGKIDIMQVHTSDLTSFFFNASKGDTAKLLRILRSLHQSYSRKKDSIKAAHTSFLTAYWILLAYVSQGRNQRNGKARDK